MNTTPQPPRIPKGRRRPQSMTAYEEELQRWQSDADGMKITLSQWLRNAALHYEAWREENAPPLKVR